MLTTLYQQTYPELHKFDAIPIVCTLSLFSSLKVLPKPLNAQDNAQVKIVGILLIFNCLRLMHANETIYS